MVECNTAQSQCIAFCVYSDCTTVIMAIMDVISAFRGLGLPIGVMMRLNG